jgi:hypothetical protein
MRKISKLLFFPALLLGAAMVLPPAPASAVIYTYTGGGTYTDDTTNPPTNGETFSGSFVFDATTDTVTSAAFTTLTFGDFTNFFSFKSGVDRIIVLDTTEFQFSLGFVDDATLLAGGPVTTDSVNSTISSGTRLFFTDALGFAGNFTPGIPEPTSWVTTLLGFAVIGFMAYRGSSKPTLTHA